MYGREERFPREQTVPLRTAFIYQIKITLKRLMVACPRKLSTFPKTIRGNYKHRYAAKTRNMHMTRDEIVWRVSQTKRTKICQKFNDSWLGRCKVHNVLSKGRCSLHNVETGALLRTKVNVSHLRPMPQERMDIFSVNRLFN